MGEPLPWRPVGQEYGVALLTTRGDWKPWVWKAKALGEDEMT